MSNTRRFTPVAPVRDSRPTSVGSAFRGKQVAWAISTPKGDTLTGVWTWGNSALTLKETIERAAQNAGFQHDFVFDYGLFLDTATDQFIEV